MYGTLISTQTLASTAASVTFSSIPGTYTDLYLVISPRMDAATVATNILVRLNGDTAANYAYRNLYGTGSVAASNSGTATTSATIYQSQPGSSATVSTFGNVLLTIPNYAGSTAKVLSAESVTENNAADSRQAIHGASWTGTAAITSIDLISQTTTNFVAGSTFSLYGLTHF